MAKIAYDPLIEGEADWALGMTSTTPSLSIHLYVSDTTPACDDSVGMYTECSLAGYAPIDLDPASWVCTLASCVKTCTYPAITWAFTAGGQTIYGYYIYNDTDGSLWWGERFDTPFAVPTDGGTLTGTLVFQERQCPA